jgi:hypothetical protein
MCYINFERAEQLKSPKNQWLQQKILSARTFAERRERQRKKVGNFDNGAANDVIFDTKVDRIFDRGTEDA